MCSDIWTVNKEEFYCVCDCNVNIEEEDSYSNMWDQRFPRKDLYYDTYYDE